MLEYFRKKKWFCWKCVVRKSGFVYKFTFRSKCAETVRLKTIDTFRWLGGLDVTHPTWVQKVPCSFPSYGKDVWSFLLKLCFHIFFQNTLFFTFFLNFFCNSCSCSFFNLLQHLWRIIRVSRYKPSSFEN